MNKKFVLNADDFGMSNAYNTAVLEGYRTGILKSASLTANGNAFDKAVKDIIPECEGISAGVHLNIIEGKSLLENLDELTDINGEFNNSFGQLLIKSFKPNNKNFLKQVEEEFRAQIEKVRDAGIQISHIDSHVHTHAIPPLFNIAAKLANEYDIKQIRTQYERFYIIPDLLTIISRKFAINIIKIVLLALFTLINKKTVEKYKLCTNDYILGVGYTSMMTSLTVSCGLQTLKGKEGITVEALIHPCRYEDGTIDNHFAEYQITKNEQLKKKILRLGYEITNYKEI